MDADWTLNLPYLKELPKGKCICELDGTTNIFKAKEILNGHMCIMGDVPATLLTLGKPDEVTAYCMNLIDVIGKGGGFILSTGCECPVDAKFENVKAMFDTAKNYYPHGSALG
jgi:uroporphyrinogen-III decarboxylase